MATVTFTDSQLDELHTLGKFCNRLHELGINRKYDTIRYWARVGIKSKANEDERIKLRTTIVGGNDVTNLRWFREFTKRLEEDRRNGQ